MQTPTPPGNRLAVADHEFMGLLSAAEREELLQRARTQRLNARQVLFQKGDPGDKLFVIVSGLLEIGVDTEDGKHLVFNLLSSWPDPDWWSTVYERIGRWFGPCWTGRRIA